MTEPRESFGGRLVLFVVLLALVVGPTWMLLTALVMQLAPDLVGAEWVLRDDGVLVVETSMASWFVGGALTGVPLGALVAGFFAAGGAARLWASVQRRFGWGSDPRFAQLAGDAPLADVTLRSTTRRVSDPETARPTDGDA